MAKIEISPITSQFASTEALNNRFLQIENELNNRVLYRTLVGTEGEDNHVSVDIDLNGNKIINSGEPIDPMDLVRLQDVQAMLGGTFSHSLLQELENDDHPQYLLRWNLESGEPILILGKLLLGGAEDEVAQGGLAVHHQANGYGVLLKTPSTSTPFDMEANPNTYLQIGEVSEGMGGAEIVGYAAESYPGLSLAGSTESPANTDVDPGAIHLQASKANAGSAVPLDADENALTVGTGVSNLLIVKGDGTLVTASGVKPSPSSDALSVYQEGDFTPVLGGSVSNGSPVYTVQVGRYTRIGRKVSVQGTLITSSVAGISGNLQITGFPYASANVTGLVSVGMAVTTGGTVACQLQPGSAILNLVHPNTSALLTESSLVASTTIQFSLEYTV